MARKGKLSLDQRAALSLAQDNPGIEYVQVCEVAISNASLPRKRQLIRLA